MTITAQDIKALRDKTGISMSKCKEALVESNGNMEEAILYLRKAGMASAMKKEGRSTKEGLIACAENQEAIVLLELSAETDFVAQNEDFKQFLSSLTDALLESGCTDLESFAQTAAPHDPSLSIEKWRATYVQKIGENLQLRRMLRWNKEDAVQHGHYLHLGGKLAVVVEGKGLNDMLSKDLGMHIASESPLFLNEGEVPQDLIERERSVGEAQIQGKPANVVEKILEGKIRAFKEQSCLYLQKFVKDDKKTIEQLLKEEKATITRFVRWNVGETI